MDVHIYQSVVSILKSSNKYIAHVGYICIQQPDLKIFKHIDSHFTNCCSYDE